MDAKKKRTTVYIDPDVLVRAQDLGLNVSKTCENSLITAIKALECVYNVNPPNNAESDKEWWAGQDLNLRPPPRKGGVLTRLDDRPTPPRRGMHEA